MEQILFKSVLIGFDKIEVLNYIENLIKANDTKQELLQKQIKKLSDDNKDMSSELAKIEIYDQYNDEIKNELEILRLENKENKNLLKEKAEQISNQEQELADLKFKISSMKEKNQKYDDTVKQVGLVMLEARNTADAIILGAQKKVDSAKCETAEIFVKIFEKAEQLKSDATNLRKIIGDVVTNFDSNLEDVCKMLDQMKENLNDLKIETSLFNHKIIL